MFNLSYIENLCGWSWPHAAKLTSKVVKIIHCPAVGQRHRPKQRPPKFWRQFSLML
jgi:hypothetical protein